VCASRPGFLIEPGLLGVGGGIVPFRNLTRRRRADQNRPQVPRTTTSAITTGVQRVTATATSDTTVAMLSTMPNGVRRGRFMSATYPAREMGTGSEQTTAVVSGIGHSGDAGLPAKSTTATIPHARDDAEVDDAPRRWRDLRRNRQPSTSERRRGARNRRPERLTP
jgi:hypothetical protein